ncbi:uncharacterized protein LOC113850890 [Abrus precatorius]|uniref:Uncharacterized protein LOC113850890 n=1 Tax=Abrus precatorius TaxID=3816 RepID=A0A8B8K0H0_ABRPR|nr:uncharacterized protein LOC113850890 [Abrus precatorius]
MEWNGDCQEAIEKIQNPPILVPPVPERPLIMYLTVLGGSMGCVLDQHDESAWATRRLRQYMLSHATWLVLLSEYDIMYVTQKAIKGIALADFLAHQLMNDYQSIQYEFPNENIMALFNEKEFSTKDEWVMIFDSASNALGHRIGAILISSEKQYILIKARSSFDCTNNIAEYEACAIRIQAAIESKIKILEVCGDSALVIHELKGEWETRDAKLIPYQAYIRELVEYFDEITFHYIPREENQLGDALATLSSMFVVS